MCIIEIMTTVDLITAAGVAVAYLGVGVGAYFHLDNKIDTKFEVLDKKIDTKFDILDKKFDQLTLQIQEVIGLQREMNGQLMILAKMAHEHEHPVSA